MAQECQTDMVLTICELIMMLTIFAANEVRQCNYNTFVVTPTLDQYCTEQAADTVISADSCT